MSFNTTTAAGDLAEGTVATVPDVNTITVTGTGLADGSATEAGEVRRLRNYAAGNRAYIDDIAASFFSFGFGAGQATAAYAQAVANWLFREQAAPGAAIWAQLRNDGSDVAGWTRVDISSFWGAASLPAGYDLPSNLSVGSDQDLEASAGSDYGPFDELGLYTASVGGTLGIRFARTESSVVTGDRIYIPAGTLTAAV